MTTRHAGYIVILAEDIRHDDAEPILTAIRMVKGVLTVKPVESSSELVIAEERAGQVWRERLFGLLASGR